MKKLQFTRDALAFGLSVAAPIMLAASLTGCTDSTAPGASESSAGTVDSAVLAHAVHFHLDLASGAMTVAGMAASRSATVTGGGANRALLGDNEVTMRLFHLSHIIPKQGRDSIVMEVALLNNLQNSDLGASTSPASPAQDSVVLAMVQVAANPTGNAIPTGAWRGIGASSTNMTKWNMVTGAACYTGKDCSVWTPVAPIAAGKVSAHFTIGFTVPKGSTGVDGYLFVGADVHDAPLPGTVAGTLKGLGVGALSDAGVTLDGATAVTTTADGMFVFAGVKAGTHTISFSGIPSYCSAAPQTVTVSADQATQLTLTVPCYGTLAGTVTVLQGPLAFANVYVNGSLVASTDAAGHYSAQSMLVGAQTVTVSNIRGCPDPGAMTVTILPGQTFTKDVSLDCSPLVGTVQGVLTEGGVPVANGTVTFRVGTAVFVATTGADGSYALTVQIGDGHAFGADTQRPLCLSPIAGVPYTLASQTAPAVVNLDLTCTPAPTFGTIQLPVATVGVMYSYRLPATANVTFELSAGGLQVGLSLSPDGVISGSPLYPIAADLFSVRITDAFGRTADSGTLTLVVTQTP